MADVKKIESEQEWKNILEASKEKPVLMFKHSTTCPISAQAFDEYKSFATDVDQYYLVVSESRPVSNQLAEDLGIRHESPQAFLLKDGKAAWNASHSNITERSLQTAVNENA